jgi:hypothetical protein
LSAAAMQLSEVRGPPKPPEPTTKTDIYVFVVTWLSLHFKTSTYLLLLDYRYISKHLHIYYLYYCNISKHLRIYYFYYCNISKHLHIYYFYYCNISKHLHICYLIIAITLTHSSWKSG